tara:strand:+ start:817 stop:1140 length:324 start_codon:yes stop_codon:yes gene_type:complete
MPRRVWTKLLILQKIQLLPKESRYSTHVKEVNGSLWKAAVRYFGSWGEAIIEAGFNYEEIVKIGPRVAPNKGSGGTCLYPNCTSKHHASGHCQIHYNMMRRNRKETT